MFVVEAARDEDAADLVALASDALPVSFEPEWWHARVVEGNCIVAREVETQDLVGFAIASKAAPCEAHLEAIAVAGTIRGRGIGSMLLRSVEDSLRRQGIMAVHLESRADDAQATSFYTRHGFEPEGLVEGLYGDGQAAIRWGRPL